MNQNTLVNSAQSIVAQVRMCQIEDAQKTLENQIETLCGAMENLEQRLAPVLQPCAPCDPINKPSTEEMLVPVAADYRERFKQVLNLTNRVQGMLQRLELP